MHVPYPPSGGSGWSSHDPSPFSAAPSATFSGDDPAPVDAADLVRRRASAESVRLAVEWLTWNMVLGQSQSAARRPGYLLLNS